MLDINSESRANWLRQRTSKWIRIRPTITVEHTAPKTHGLDSELILIVYFFPLWNDRDTALQNPSDFKN